MIIVERRQLFQDCLALWLARFCSEFEVVALADAKEVVSAHVLAKASVVVVVEESLAPADEWINEQISILRENTPDIQIVMISDASQMRVAKALVVQGGLQGYIPTTSNVKVAAAALRLVAAGGVYFPPVPARERPGMRSIEEPQISYPNTDMRSTLTSREQAVTALVCQGLPNKLIAYRLGMSISTVKAHVHSIIKKLHLRNRIEVALTTRPPVADPLQQLTTDKEIP
jgi:DNA-binding NarL/FixJ family response regulator